MRIDNELIEKVTGLSSERPFEADKLVPVGNRDISNAMSFLDDVKFIENVNNNRGISAVFVTKELAAKLEYSAVVKVICDDPRYYFYTLYNYFAIEGYKKIPSKIDPSARIHAKAFISEYNIEIGKMVVIEPNATILPDVCIGDNCRIMPGAVLGSTGFEYKRTSKGILPVIHDGKVILHSNVEIGANTCIDKGFSFRDTIIGDNTKIDNLVHIAHSAHIGKNCFIIAGAMIAGSVTLGNDVWIGPHANIAPQVNVGDNGFVTLGAVVTKDVPSGEMVSGVFAMPHKKFIELIKRNSK